VFSTLHTNDSASAITRLVDIGVEPFLISSSVIAVIAQRLVRVLCGECKQPFVPDDVILERAGFASEHIRKHTIIRAKGCERCLQTGYKGRIGIFEIMVLNDDIKRLVLKTFDSNRIKHEALRHRMVTLREDGIHKVLKGMTSLEEILRVTDT
ncbi:MAG TPA: type II secretion system protein GspE, partial [Chromatiaceae bacterium]|nr:type II secretion system protein GspE [Chromatiaceae bacterium]